MVENRSLADIHFPFHDNGALGLAYELVQRVQPGLIVVGSDAFDFALLSSFGVDPDTDVGYEDELEGMERYWNEHIHEIKARSPGSRLVYIMGNHERRIVRYLIQNAPALRKTVLNRFMGIVRAGGSVLWMGETDRVRVGPLLVQHGNRVGIHVAKGHLDDLGYQVSTMFGHVHKLNFFSKTGEDFTVQGVASGCLCQLRPHYVRGTALRQKWEHGTAIADIDLNGRDVSFSNLLFHQDRDRTYTRFERETVEYWKSLKLDAVA